MATTARYTSGTSIGDITRGLMSLAVTARATIGTINEDHAKASTPTSVVRSGRRRSTMIVATASAATVATPTRAVTVVVDRSSTS